MPYIKQVLRRALSNRENEDIETPGELNYLITTLCSDYLGETPKYSDINEVVGVLECAKLELYRRIAAPYEDKACEENGDVYQGGET